MALCPAASLQAEMVLSPAASCRVVRGQKLRMISPTSYYYQGAVPVPVPDPRAGLSLIPEPGAGISLRIFLAL